MIRCLLLVAATGLAACNPAPSTDDAPVDAAGAPASAMAASPADTASTATAADTTWTVRFDGAGPVRVGMTPDEARAALGGDFAVAAGTAAGSTCEYAQSAAAPAGVAFMVEDGRVVRVDVRDSSTAATREGARVGDTEARVQELYGGRVRIQPHKYEEGGRYLTVLPAEPRDGRLRLVFETDGERVTRFRAGVTPQVEYVEGCG